MLALLLVGGESILDLKLTILDRSHRSKDAAWNLRMAILDFLPSKNKI
ncbi:hypothetical protein [Nostoc sp. ChiQUE01b]|nr:hypothetical protein [Nostoc sp. ChiQUE01b]